MLAHPNVANVLVEVITRPLLLAEESPDVPCLPLAVVCRAVIHLDSFWRAWDDFRADRLVPWFGILVLGSTTGNRMDSSPKLFLAGDDVIYHHHARYHGQRGGQTRQQQTEVGRCRLGCITFRNGVSLLLPGRE